MRPAVYGATMNIRYINRELGDSIDSLSQRIKGVAIMEPAKYFLLDENGNIVAEIVDKKFIDNIGLITR